MNVALPSAVSKNTYDPHALTLPYDTPSTHRGKLYIPSKSPSIQSCVAFTPVTFCIIPLDDDWSCSLSFDLGSCLYLLIRLHKPAPGYSGYPLSQNQTPNVWMSVIPFGCSASEPLLVSEEPPTLWDRALSSSQDLEFPHTDFSSHSYCSSAITGSRLPQPDTSSTTICNRNLRLRSCNCPKCIPLTLLLTNASSCAWAHWGQTNQNAGVWSRERFSAGRMQGDG